MFTYFVKKINQHYILISFNFCCMIYLMFFILLYVKFRKQKKNQVKFRGEVNIKIKDKIKF